MKFGSLCSGIEAASAAWNPLGWEAAFVAEIEKFPCQVLKKHYPNVPNFGDITKFKEWPDVSINLLCGGTPCQSFSIAGLRKGLDDPRGNLMLTYLAIARRYRPDWLVWENVPGVISSWSGSEACRDKDGRGIEPREWRDGDSFEENSDFASFLEGLRECGYGFAYRVFDAQYFGVAQRRQRVFVVGHSGGWRGPAAVLFDAESLSGNPPPRRKKNEVTSAAAGGDFKNGSHWDGGPHPALAQSHNTGAIGYSNQELFSPRGAGLVSTNRMVAFGEYVDDDTASAIKARDYKDATDLVCGSLPIAFDARQDPVSSEEVFGALGCSHPQAQAIASAEAVRRLTPIECERLQGFPDNYTKLDDKTADGPRYKALGNSWAVPNVRWIGRRIQMVEDILNAQKEGKAL